MREFVNDSVIKEKVAVLHTVSGFGTLEGGKWTWGGWPQIIWESNNPAITSRDDRLILSVLVWVEGG